MVLNQFVIPFCIGRHKFRELSSNLFPAKVRCILISRFFSRQRKVADRAGFRDFIIAESAFMAQKATIEYCRARAGANAVKLFEEDAFLQALARSTWESLAAVLSDALTVAEGELRRHAGGGHALLHLTLADLYRDCLGAHPRPAHRPEGWADAEAAFAMRLAKAQVADPQPAERIARESAARVFALLPIHDSLRRLDEEIVSGNLRFAMIGFQEKLVRRVDIPAVAAVLLAEAATCAGSASAAGR